MAVKRKVAELVASIPESNQWKVDREIDFENTDIRGRTIPQHLGRIAAEMTNWEDTIADLLGLTGPDRADIMEKYPRKPSLQRREALNIWKSRLGSQATYRALMEVFVKANRLDCTKSIVEISKERAETDTPPEAGAAATAGPPPPVSTSSGSGGAPSTGSGTATAATPQSQAQTPPGNTTTSTGDVGFSPNMTPEQLAQWLLQEYGESYKPDIDKLKGALINGELFLELPDDKDLLEELQLSGTFKRLITRKVKQLKESSSTSASVPIAASNGKASLPPTEVTTLKEKQKQSSGAKDNDHGSSQSSSNGQANSGASDAQTATSREPSVTAQATVPTVLRSTDRLPPELLPQVLDVMWPARTKSSGVGLALGLAPDALDAIEKSHSYRVDDVFTEMMKVCLRQGLVTQQKLADAVSSRQVSFGYLSEEILAAKFTISKTACPPLPAAHVTTPGVGVSMPAAAADGDRINIHMSNECITFISDIKEMYHERRTNREKQWPPCHSDKLVRLEIVEREKGEGYSASTQRGREDKGVKRTPLAYGDLFKVESGKRPIRKVLVEGDAGIGKTTLCIAVSEDWANGKLFQQFELVLLLPLRMKAVASAGSIPELLKLLHPSPRLCDSVARYFEGTMKRVLVIADGWDELNESERHEGSFLYQLIFNSVISVVLTSRPSASAPLRELPDIDRFIEVRGFSKDHIVEYIQSEFASDQEKADRLLEQLEYNPLVESVCSVPLNCAIVCHLWRTLEGALPTTMTELYTKIILSIILRNIRKMETFVSVLTLSTFESLPVDLQQSWWLLCKFAFKAFENDQLVFSQEELETFFPKGVALDKRILCFGLLQTAESVGVGVSFHFLHLTFQEYLAALHLARQPPGNQLEVFQSHKSEGLYFPNRFVMIWKFFFGILGFNRDTNSFIQQILKCVAGEDYSQDNLSLCHCAFEAQNDLINNKVIQCLTHYSGSGYRRSMIEFDFPRTAHDCTAVLHVIANMQECERMKINFGNCGVRDNQIKRLKSILVDRKGKLHITSLDLSGSRLTVAGLQALENIVCGDLLAKLEELVLAGSLTSNTDTNAAWLIMFGEALSVHCPHLNSLDLSHNNLGVPGTSALVGCDFLTKYTLKIKILRLAGSLTSDADSNATFVEALLAYCPNIENLDLSNNNLCVSDVSVLSRICDHLTCGKPSDHKNFRINFSRTNLDNKSLTLLYSLDLAGNDIDASGISCLADAICSVKFVITNDLNLSDNLIGVKGTLIVGRMLSSSHCRLKEVYLSKCELTTDLLNTDSLNISDTISCEAVGQQLCQIPQNSNIELLSLDGNSFTGEGIHILAGFMYLCPSLQFLVTRDCGITSDDLIWLLDKLTQLNSSSPSLCSKLMAWYLDNNQIDDRGVSALIDHLPSLFPCVYGARVFDIFIYNNPISSEMEKKLSAEVSRLRPKFKSLPSLPVLPAPSPLPSSQPSPRPVPQAPFPQSSEWAMQLPQPVPQTPSPLPSSQPSPLSLSQPSPRPVPQAPSLRPSKRTSCVVL